MFVLSPSRRTPGDVEAKLFKDRKGKEWSRSRVCPPFVGPGERWVTSRLQRGLLCVWGSVMGWGRRPSETSFLTGPLLPFRPQGPGRTPSRPRRLAAPPRRPPPWTPVQPRPVGGACGLLGRDCLSTLRGCGGTPTLEDPSPDPPSPTESDGLGRPTDRSPPPAHVHRPRRAPVPPPRVNEPTRGTTLPRRPSPDPGGGGCRGPRGAWG